MPIAILGGERIVPASVLVWNFNLGDLHDHLFTAVPKQAIDLALADVVNDFPHSWDPRIIERNLGGIESVERNYLEVHMLRIIVGRECAKELGQCSFQYSIFLVKLFTSVVDIPSCWTGRCLVHSWPSVETAIRP